MERCSSWVGKYNKFYNNGNWEKYNSFLNLQVNRLLCRRAFKFIDRQTQMGGHLPNANAIQFTWINIYRIATTFCVVFGVR